VVHSGVSYAVCAGMSLVDTTDNILMLGAYGWAFVKPIRKLYYNMTITLVSALVAGGGWNRSRLPAGRTVPSSRNVLGSVGKLNKNFGTLDTALLRYSRCAGAFRSGYISGVDLMISSWRTERIFDFA